MKKIKKSVTYFIKDDPKDLGYMSTTVSGFALENFKTAVSILGYVETSKEKYDEMVHRLDTELPDVTE